MGSKTKKVAKSKFAGMIAPPLVAGLAAAKREKLDMHIRVKPEQLAQMTRSSIDVILAAEMVKDAAEQVVAAFAAPQKRLHRRVQITVQDWQGAQISAAVHDLVDGDVLDAQVSATGMSAGISHTEGTR
jgi:hypothetical protein